VNNLSTALAALTGLTYGVMKYYLAGRDPDSRLGHPLQPTVAKAHLLVVPVVVFAFGLLFRSHALQRLKGKETRGPSSGALMLLFFAPLVFTGYGVQALPDARAVGWAHAALGVLFALYWLVHLKRSGSAAS
jgi:hypothetical protein